MYLHRADCLHIMRLGAVDSTYSLKTQLKSMNLYETLTVHYFAFAMRVGVEGAR